MATILSLGTWVQLACPRPPTPITAIFKRLFGEQLRRLGITNAPAADTEAVVRNDLRDRFFMAVFFIKE